MARDPGLEELMRGLLAGERVSERPMFGGLCWMMSGHLLCGARDDGALVRLGKDRDAWALKLEGVSPMISRGRAMSGWVRVAPEAFGDEALAGRLLAEAIAFVRSLPPK